MQEGYYIILSYDIYYKINIFKQMQEGLSRLTKLNTKSREVLKLAYHAEIVT